jgi:hypothetical protein
MIEDNICNKDKTARKLTLPVLNSIQAAFFLLSVAKAPAIVHVIVLGGTCRRPGPSVRVFFFPVGLGRASCGISSPGMTIVVEVAMRNECGGLWRKVASCAQVVLDAKTSKDFLAGPDQFSEQFLVATSGRLLFPRVHTPGSFRPLLIVFDRRKSS